MWSRTSVDCGDVNDWRLLWRGQWWGGKAGCKGENLLLTASSKSKSREQGKKKEIENQHLFKAEKGERNASFQSGKGLGGKEEGLEEAEKLLTVSSKPSRRQATAVAMFLCLTLIFLLFTFLLNPCFLRTTTYIIKRTESRNQL